MKNLFKLVLMLFAVAMFVACGTQNAENTEDVVEEGTEVVEETPEVVDEAAEMVDTVAEEAEVVEDVVE